MVRPPPPRPPGINAQARRLQKGRSRVTSLFVGGGEGVGAGDLGFWRSLSEMDLLAMEAETGRAPLQTTPPPPLGEDPEVEADKEALLLRRLRLGGEKEETESSDDHSTQFSVHPPFDFPYFLLLQGYSHKQVSLPRKTAANK